MDQSAPQGPAFAHASEAELARILDFYEVRWEYEPHTFPILWNLDGAVVESFSPDFYLPDLDMYLELTTLKQSLVRKKNRKLRRLRELYPGLRIKLFYGRDFRALMLKYGKLTLHDEMSGTLGQATPRLRAPIATLGPVFEALIELGPAAEVGSVGSAADETATETGTTPIPPSPVGATPRRRRRRPSVGHPATAGITVVKDR